MKSFKENFMWGGSLSSMQAEGAWNTDGKGLTVYDTKKKRTYAQTSSDWENGIDFYHHYKEDIALFAEMGFNTYRFSLSWARVLPDGEGEVNQAGLDFYDRVVNELIAQNIEPIVCLYHFDLPDALAEKYGGWQSRKVLEAYQQYAELMIKHFGKRVRYYIPINEQNVAYTLTSDLLPEDIEPKELARYEAQSQHHSFLASASVKHLVNAFAPHAQVGGMVAFSPFYPESSHPDAILSAQIANRRLTYQTTDVFVNGEYPQDLLHDWEKQGIMPEITAGDKQYLKEGTVDFLPFSYYQSAMAKKGADITVDSFLDSFLDGTQPKNDFLAVSEWGWIIDPKGLRLAAKELFDRYKLPVFTVECGIGVKETLNAEGTVEDDYRIDYLRDHVEQLRLAVTEDGVDLMGFLTWGPIDILSSQGEMKKRYGFIYVNRDETDLKDLKRYKKKSFYWFKQVITSNGDDLWEKATLLEYQSSAKG
ncbi:glycoside hydrolase family 1 protein [uncultured Enterococcus sp.]|uniref:glycoside hydrolase family 1 protein n=1 Tax=uncultured Enterococcus sp. TaxID=167972 RepID=UPI002583122D|nr:glycoside hydrolase family 1 protein [uncultured Enterococcus sp.]